MRDWNVVVTVREGGYQRARELLAPYGPVKATEYYNVLVMRVEDVEDFTAALAARATDEPELLRDLSRVMPVSATFLFQRPEEFEYHAKESCLPWLDSLAGRTFHVRMHRRGFKGSLSSQDEERFLDGFILSELDRRGAPARITFEDPDYILVVETVGQRAGMALWSREDLQRYPFLHLD